MKRSGLLCAGLGVLLAGLAVAAGMQTNCRNVVQDYIVNEWCGGFRSKRSSPDDGLDPGRDLESGIRGSRIRKRQAMTLSEIIMTSRVPVYHYRHPHGPSYVETVYVPVVPATVTDDQKAKQEHEILPQEKNSDLGFEVEDELEELYEELYDRLTRSPNQSDNEVHEDAMNAFYDCCMDKQQCHRVRKIVQCP